MDAVPKEVLIPNTLQELFTLWKQFPNALPFAGGTQILRYQGRRFPELQTPLLSLDRIEELRQVTRTEQYIEIGAMVRLNDIISLGKIIPDVFIRCLESIAGRQVRNLATIGGNICHPPYRLDTSAPLIALDAHYELRSASSARWISALRFSGHSEPLPINSQELLTRIRIPLEQWDYSLYKKIKHVRGEKQNGGIVFIIRNQKNILTDMRFVFSGDLFLRNRNAEILLIGKHLPLDRKDAYNFVEQWKTYLSSFKEPVDNFLQFFLINFIESTLLSFSK
jgi:CO/xanthine dehydrogenase FAD-binding subunit